MNRSSSSLRDRISTGLMLVAALAAVYAFVTAIGVALQAGPATQQVEWWRALGFLMFASIFVLLAFWPRRYPYLFELVILNKLILTIVEIFLIANNAENAASAAVADAVLVALLVAAYILSRRPKSLEQQGGR
jgi:prepilin signal peptidase PulO-like enzyme (type II secretory pathway)